MSVNSELSLIFKVTLEKETISSFVMSVIYAITPRIQTAMRILSISFDLLVNCQNIWTFM